MRARWYEHGEKSTKYFLKFVDQIELPQFYKLILLYFLELKESFPNQSGQEQILFNNKDILIHGHSIFLQELV